MRKVRWGIISTANINRRVIPAIRESKRGELVAVASRKLETATAYADDWKIPLAYGSYQDMLNTGEIDAVYISLPNHLHAEWSIKAMEAGIHVLCEKPFAITIEEVDAMIATREKTGLVLAEAFMYRHHPQTITTGELIQTGQLGDISLVRGAFDFAFTSTNNVRLVPAWGGGSLWDVGVYPMSFAQYILGEPPQWVSGSQWLGNTGVDETFVGQMGYSGDRFAQISSAFRTPFHTFFEIIGTNGRLILDMPFVGVNEGTMTYINPKGIEEVIPVPKEYLYLGEIRDMHRAILDGKPNYLSLNETRNHIKTVLALYESARSGNVIHLMDI